MLYTIFICKYFCNIISTHWFGFVFNLGSPNWILPETKSNEMHLQMHSWVLQAIHPHTDTHTNTRTYTQTDSVSTPSPSTFRVLAMPFT